MRKGGPLPEWLPLPHPTEPSLGPAQPHSLAYWTSVLLGKLVATSEDRKCANSAGVKDFFFLALGFAKLNMVRRYHFDLSNAHSPRAKIMYRMRHGCHKIYSLLHGQDVCVDPMEDPDVFITPFVRNMVFFELFLYCFSPLSMLFYPFPLFSQFHSSRKDNTRAIDPIT